MHPLVFAPATSLFHTPDMMDSCDSVSIPIDRTYSSASIFDASPHSWKNVERKGGIEKRLRLTVESLAKNHANETVLVNSHGGPCTHIFEELIGQKAPTSVGYTAISIYEYQIDQHGSFSWKNLILNDTEHLWNNWRHIRITQQPMSKV